MKLVILISFNSGTLVWYLLVMNQCHSAPWLVVGGLVLAARSGSQTMIAQWTDMILPHISKLIKSWTSGWYHTGVALFTWMLENIISNVAPLILNIHNLKNYLVFFSVWESFSRGRSSGAFCGSQVFPTSWPGGRRWHATPLEYQMRWDQCYNCFKKVNISLCSDS